MKALSSQKGDSGRQPQLAQEAQAVGQAQEAPLSLVMLLGPWIHHDLNCVDLCALRCGGRPRGGTGLSVTCQSASAGCYCQEMSSGRRL